MALVLALTGCGLTLDLEPPEGRADGSVSDFGPPVDQGRVDASKDLGSTDLGEPSDAGSDLGSAADLGGPGDGGLDLSVVRTCAEGCDADEFCQATHRVCLETVGVCRPRPPASDCLADPETPVCGCDYRNYRNDCAAAAAGVVVAFLEACPAFGDTDDWCDLEPPESTVDGCIPCYDDADCIDRTTTAFECVGSTCTADGIGRCAFNLPVGRCYYDIDCRTGERCEGAELYGCEDPAGLVPVQGTCR